MNCTCQKAMLSRDGSMCCRCGGKGIMDLGPVAPGWKRDSAAVAVKCDAFGKNVVGKPDPLPPVRMLNPDLVSEENIRRLIDEWAQSGIKMPLDMPRLSSFLHRKLTGKE